MNADRLTSMIWFAIGLWAISSSISLGLGTTREPGPGFFPILAGTFISLMAIIIFVQSLKKREDKKLSDFWKGLRWKKTLAIGLIMIGYILTFEWLGFPISTFLFLLILLKGMESVAWRKVLLISIISTGFSYLLLSISLESTLPKGIFGF